MAMKRVMEITTPLGGDELLFHRMQTQGELKNERMHLSVAKKKFAYAFE